MATLVLGILLSVSSAQANPRYAAIVIDSQNGEVLHSANADATRYPASLTKMMTLYLAFEALDEGRISLDQPLPVSSYAASMQPSKLGVKAGDSITLRNAIPALIIRSANDVAVVVAEALGGTERQFAEMMTAKARSLGMKNTYFRNANGLPDPLQTSTARELATLSVRLMNDFPHHYHYFSNSSFSYRGQTINGHNRLLRNYPGADGLKTGFIRASGFNVATSAVRDGRRIVAVVMGGFTAQSRDDHMMTLLDRGFMRAALNDQNGWVAETSIAQPMETLVASVQGASSEVASAPQATTAMADLQTQPAASSEPLRLIAALDARPRSSEPSTLSDAPTRAEPSFDYRDDNDPILAVLSATGVASEGSIEQADWAIQVGAYQDFDKARDSASRAADFLPSIDQPLSRVAVTEVETSDRKIFRARLVDLQENQARETCHRLAQNGLDCQVVTP
ncbi:D-alanyl-D-alanine carboxypeptidase [Halomonas sp. ML-15]|uniref:D-alanyl-D-alanine carboxypeptidase family protein n=1 Tax=Halomonas sp. ML-15 TaxID=2773305 RepID=UPI001747C59C|nr:D-alanyl-D-alanine carboxypeptidase family protein [Halomonas sp. ML-15]MBD3897856.1 D-alanyl-D-alanine carboxypeptidase [Halomonas sp. ML-15]